MDEKKCTLSRWSAPLALAAVALAASQPARALTAEEVLQLKQAGVSDATIQQMLENERNDQEQQKAVTDDVPAAMQEQKFANDNIGTWNTSDGRVVLSTGRADPSQDVFDPTVPQSGANAYPMSVYPYVFPGAPVGPPGPGPVSGPNGPIGGAPAHR